MAESNQSSRQKRHLLGASLNRSQLRQVFDSLTLFFLLSLTTAVFGQERSLKVTALDGTDVGGFTASYALVIGEALYNAGWPKLSGTAEDADAVKRALEVQGFHVTVKADLASGELERAYTDFIDAYGFEEGNRLLFYYAGHGHTLKLASGLDMGYIVPTDAPNPEIDPTGFKRKAVPMQQFDTWAKNIEARHALFLFDSCFSGSIFAISRAMPTNISEKTLSAVRQFITSGSADETVPDRSVFRDQFVAGIGGEADRNGDAYVTGAELGEFLDEKVVNYSYAAQHPQYGKIRDPNLDKGDFVFKMPAGASGAASGTKLGATTGAVSVLPAVPEVAELFVVSDPAEAEVLIDGVFVGMSGALFEKVPAGRPITIEARRAAWAARTIVTLAPGELRDLKLTLEPLKGNLILKAKGASDCMVQIDGRDLGAFGTGLFRDLEAGDHDAVVHGPGLLWQGKVNVPEGKTAQRDIVLTELGNLDIIIPSDAGFRLSRDDEVFFDLYGGHFRTDLPIGAYIVEGFGMGYDTISAVVSVNRAETTRWEPWTTGSMTIATIPSGAEVVVDGKSLGKSPATARNLPAGTVRIAVKLNGYEESAATMPVSVGKNTTTVFGLDKLGSTKALHNEIYVEGTSFKMGSVTGGDEEKAVSTANVDSFWMMKTEVTQKDYAALMGSNPAMRYGVGDNYPVYNVSWYNALAYANTLSQKNGLEPAYIINGYDVICDWQSNGWRLPTEAEWEYAARGGKLSRGYTYSGSSDLDSVAWYASTTEKRGAKPVATKAANELGLYDLSGNVMEWCWDWHGAYGGWTQTNPSGSDSGVRHLVCGGGWISDSQDLLPSAARGGAAPTELYSFLGFRLVRRCSKNEYAASPAIEAENLENPDKTAISLKKKGIVSLHDESFVEGGSFWMGSNSGEDDEKPVHMVTVDSFWMMKTEVIQREYIALMDRNPSVEDGEYGLGDTYPVFTVLWADAVAYANKLSRIDGLEEVYTIDGTDVVCDWSANGWRLPTEAEWEYAARGGKLSRGYTYAGADDADSVAWYYANSEGAKPVAAKAANELGLYDMSGNIWEWCWDLYEAYSDEPHPKPRDTRVSLDRNNDHIIRGGAWGTGEEIRPTDRHWPGSTFPRFFLGFRLVRSF